MISTRDFVTRENHWQITPLVTKKIVIHGNSCIILYIFSLLVKKPVHAILLIFKQVKHQYNLQYLSYHYHHYNEHYISKFWQVRNLRLPFHFVCYLTKLDLYRGEPGVQCWLDAWLGTVQIRTIPHVFPFL